MNDVMICPVCHEAFPASQIPDGILQSERGRRNNAKRTNKGGWKTRRRMIWREHKEGLYCRCWTCLWMRLYQRQANYQDSVLRVLALAGGVRPMDYDARMRAFYDEATELMANRPPWVRGIKGMEPPPNPFLPAL